MSKKVLFDFFHLVSRRFYQKEKHDADYDEIENGGNKIANFDTSDHDAGKIGVSNDHADNGRDQIIDQGVDNFLKGTADNDCYCQCEYFAPEQECFKFADHNVFVLNCVKKWMDYEGKNNCF